MSSPNLLFWIVAAALLFWVVGAYNRMVRLRGELARRFATLEEQYRLRHALLTQQLDALAPVLTSAAPRLDALRAACGQTENALAHARVRPAAVGPITSLRLAEEILAEARARLPAPGAVGTALPDLAAQLATLDTTLGFARGQFNDAVRVYNHAIRQFPTRLLAAVFGFRPGAAL